VVIESYPYGQFRQFIAQECARMVWASTEAREAGRLRNIPKIVLLSSV
jgi:hypothetical protein